MAFLGLGVAGIAALLLGVGGSLPDVMYLAAIGLGLVVAIGEG